MASRDFIQRWLSTPVPNRSSIVRPAIKETDLSPQHVAKMQVAAQSNDQLAALLGETLALLNYPSGSDPLQHLVELLKRRDEWFDGRYQSQTPMSKSELTAIADNVAANMADPEIAAATAFEAFAQAQILRKKKQYAEALSAVAGGAFFLARAAGMYAPHVASRKAKDSADARHGKPGGSRDKREKIRAAWASGHYTSRDRCAEEECAGLDMSFAAARKALRNTPDPT